jgi:SNF2 family DNA or RNA helicase
MLVHKEKRALIFKLREPSKIMTVIPTAKLVRHNGSTLVAVPHRPDEVRVLRTLGFDAPDPMRLYYDWPGRFTPMKEQIETASFATMNDRCFVLNSMGTGKTITVLWTYDYLHSIKLVRSALVVCPMSVMERTWADHIFQSFPHLDATVLYGSADRRRKLLAAKADIYIINVDGLNIIKNELATRPDIDVIIADESALYRNGQTQRWKALNLVCNKQVPRRVWALTGAPTPNLPTDAWAQGRVINPTNPDVPKYFNRFRDQTMRQVSQFKWVVRPESTEIVQAALQPAIRYTLDDMVDLPEETYTARDVEMTPEQLKTYKTMMARLAAEYDGGQIMAVNEAVKMNKLVQIACGVAYGLDHEEIVIPAKPRMEVVQEIVEESEGKVLIFAPFTSVLRPLKEMLDAQYECAIVSGEVSKNERDEIYGRFQDPNDPLRVIVATPGTMSHGLTLTEASTVIWFAPIHSNEIYRQACARVRRPGQKRTTVVVHVAACDAERRMYDRLEKKENVQGVLLDMLKELSIKTTETI